MIAGLNIGFDFDGTLVECETRQTEVMRILANAVDVPSIDIAAFWRDKQNGLSNKKALLAQGMCAEHVDQLNDMWVRVIEDPVFLALDPLRSKVRELLKNLGAKNRLYLISARAKPDNLRVQIRALGLKDYFDRIDIVEAGAQASIQKAELMKKLSLDVYIGDTESDLKAAVIQNIPMVLIGEGQRSSSFLDNQKSSTPNHPITLVECPSCITPDVLKQLIYS